MNGQPNPTEVSLSVEVLERVDLICLEFESASKTGKGPRTSDIYATDDAQVSAIRFVDRWKAIYLEPKAHGSRIWLDELVELKAPLLFDLRMDPFEKALETNMYYDWYTRRIFLIA